MNARLDRIVRSPRGRRASSIGVLALLAFPVVGLAGCEAPVACVPPRIMATAPLPRLGGHWILPMTVDGVTLPMILDTGAEFSVLDQAALDALKGHEVRYLGSLVMSGVDGRVTRQAYEVDRVVLAGGALDTAGFVYEPTFPSRGGRIDGLIGNDLLHYWDVDLDGADDALQLEQPQTCDNPVAPWQVGTRTEATLSPVSGEYAFPAILGGHPVDAVIDTGADETLVAANAIDLDPASTAHDRVVSVSGIHGHVREGRMHHFDDLVIAGRSFGPLDAVVGDSGLRDELVVLGANFTTHYRIALLYQSGHVFIGDRLPRHPYRGPGIPSPAAQAGKPTP